MFRVCCYNFIFVQIFVKWLWASAFIGLIRRIWLTCQEDISLSSNVIHEGYFLFRCLNIRSCVASQWNRWFSSVEKQMMFTKISINSLSIYISTLVKCKIVLCVIKCLNSTTLQPISTEQNLKYIAVIWSSRKQTSNSNWGHRLLPLSVWDKSLTSVNSNCWPEWVDASICSRVGGSQIHCTTV